MLEDKSELIIQGYDSRKSEAWNQKGELKFPMLKRPAPIMGPNSSPSPERASSIPMFFSRSSFLSELTMAILDVEMAPAPMPP